MVTARIWKAWRMLQSLSLLLKVVVSPALADGCGTLRLLLCKACGEVGAS